MSNNNDNGMIDMSMKASTIYYPYADMNFDQLLSAYAIAYKKGDVDTFKKYRQEIMERIRKIQEAKRILSGVFL